MRRLPVFKWLLIAAVCGTSSCFAQNYFFQEFGIRDGLSASKVYAIEEDRSGKIWLGTVNGVSLFDGYGFKNFTTEHGLAPDGVRTIFQDASGTVWFGHYEGGISRYRNGNFENLALQNIRGTGDIYDFYETAPGDLWIASNGLGAIHLRNTDRQIEELDFDQFMGSEGLGDRVFDLAGTIDSSLYFITDVGIKKLEGDSTFTFYKPGQMSNMFQLTCMLEDSRGMQWFGTHNGGLYKYAPGNSDIEIFDVLDGLAHNFVFCLQEDDRGNIWAGTYGGGVSVINPNGRILTINSSNGLPDEKIQCLSTDRENNILIGTNDNGLLIFKTFQFEHLPLPEGINARRFNAISKRSDNSVWIGTEMGLIRTDLQWNYARLYSEEQGLFDPNINAMGWDRSGKLWLGTEFGGLFSFSPRTSSFESHFYINQYITQHKVTDLAIDPDNQLWLGTLDGLLRIDPVQQTLQRYSQRDGLPSNHISAIYPAPSGDVFVGVIGRGAVRVTADTILPILSTGTPACFLKDREGVLWIGLEGEGVYRIDESGAREHFTTSDGLLSNAIATIDQDENGDIWIGSHLGISKMDKEELKFLHFGFSAGFAGVEVKRRVSLNTGKEIWYGTANGIFKNIPRLEKPVYPIHDLRITEMLIEDEPAHPGEKKDLKFNQNELTFSYLTVSLTDPENVWYRTMLEGRDEHWSEWTKTRSITYNGLPEGDYRFLVQAKNRWNQEQEISAPAAFEIHPPWYRSNTFYVVAVLASVIFLVMYIKLRERKLKKEKRVLAEKVRLRTKEVVEKSLELEKKNNDILDSINYARRIQEAILIPQSEIESYGLDAFILYQPKDIVSGDFYWFNKIGNKILFAAADCTGHGVPGAFMSVVGYSILDKIAIELNETRPEVILQELSYGVEKFLRQKENEKMPKDGMDMALGVYDQHTRKLDFSGAFNPLYLVRNGEVTEFKADRFSVGSYEPGNEKQFQRHTTTTEPGDCAYVFSDGFVDQFGGPDYKKFKSRQFKKLLADIAHLPLQDQQQQLQHTLNAWMGDVEQLDDIVVVGIRF